uniref:LOW QUALITY PROTEIN: putative cytochrome P450 120 n=1 Tax=Styela clava TaxID=7725 RepID=UPI00193AAC2D|nr:LOW QUALITY PROTEIN: putative cytochrome P450 120 [Styela clava]
MSQLPDHVDTNIWRQVGGIYRDPELFITTKYLRPHQSLSNKTVNTPTIFNSSECQNLFCSWHIALHGIISLPVSVKIPLLVNLGWSKAIEAKEKLLIHIRKMIAAEKNNSSSKLDASVPKNDAYVNPNKSNVIQQMLQVPFMNRDKNIEQHILLFISSLIPKAFSSIITSFILEMAAKERANLRESAALDSQLLSRILLEVQRLWPPFLGGRRIANKDTTIGGYKIPKGYAVIYVSYFAHRDKNVFKNPDEFNPDRWLNQGNTISANSIFTFGGGERVCIGHRLIQYILQRLTKTFTGKFTWELMPATLISKNNIMESQGIEEKVLEQSVEALMNRSRELKNALVQFIAKIDHEHETLTWTSVLDSYALLSGQMSSLFNLLKAEKIAPLQNYPITITLGQDDDQYLG